MTPIRHIRKNLFKVSQSAFAEIAGTTQPSVSRWEKEELEPSRIEMDRIRSAASQRGISWNDSWFFEAPSPTEAA